VGEELKKALVQQIELIFLRENLQSNYGIVSQMNGDLYVPITLVCEYLSNFTTDQSLILDAMRATDKVVVHESQTLVKPAFKLERNTIILRDVPAEVTQDVRGLVSSRLVVQLFRLRSHPTFPLLPQEIKALFDDEKTSSQITEVRQDIGNCWFITFKSEDITTDAFLAVRAKQLRGKPVQARVKSENLLKSTYTPSYVSLLLFLEFRYLLPGASPSIVRC
jgi:la-related protein 4